ncbi:MAG: TRASH domain-containing protein [Myxococcales bacterium]|nr:TRASH domain-containing protein [Myxococcales bacterium]
MKSLIVSLLLLGAAACSRETASTQSPTPTEAKVELPAGLARVSDPSQVCMVTDQFMGKPQIAVEVEGRTYYGCCPMCKDKLNNQPELRTARDPVTSEEVDKAKALIVQDGSGKLMYFATEDTLRRYRG